MPLSNLLKSAAGTCPFCHQRAGILSREHPECRRAHGRLEREIASPTAQATTSHTLEETSLRLSLVQVARYVERATPTKEFTGGQANGQKSHQKNSAS